ncbi:autorepressor SdpR family transcription factor [Desulfitobacterium sp. AusDCA]|uniref:autorepressor SdpR family transcription factor n=1 Tax=Desulfitobacterium sp. AusDCA TaxID=3240383 RepID=UPI003DA6FCD7
MKILNETFKALSDSNRRRILEILAEGDLTAGEIADHFEITKPSISNHLNILKNANLVLCERKGQNMIYSLNTTAFQEVLKYVLNMMNVEVENNEKQ